MDGDTEISAFLHRARRKRAGALALGGLYLLAGLAACVCLSANFLAYHFAGERDTWSPFFALALLPVSIILHRYYIAGAFARTPDDGIALLVEKKYPELKNSLINASQLSRRLADEEQERWGSFAMIREAVRLAAERVRSLDAGAVADRDELRRNRNLALAAFAALLLVTAVFPDFLQRGFQNFVAPPIGQAARALSAKTPAQAGPARAPVAHKLAEMSWRFTYPAYTGLPPKSIPRAAGKVQVLPGTEVRVEAKFTPPADAVSLVLNDRERLALSASGNEPEPLAAQFIVREPGHFQFETRDGGEPPVLLREKYPVALDKDLPPKVILFVRNPKPVYLPGDKVELSYEAGDDYGLQEIRLVADINGKIVRLPVKTLRENTREFKDNFSWNLSLLNLSPGDRVQYFFEVLDNDNVSGPNTGQSAVHSFSIFDQRKERENLVLLQEEMIERMLDLLALSLVGRDRLLTDANTDPAKVRKFISISADKLIEIVRLAQNIQDQAQAIPSFPSTYLTIVRNVSAGLNELRQEEIDLLGRMAQPEIRRTSSPASSPAAQVTDKLIAQLENHLLFLVKISNREKMEQVMSLKENARDLMEQLKKQFEKSRDGKPNFSQPQFQAHLEKLRKTLSKMMEQLTKQTQGSPDEFINREAFKSFDMENFNAALERIRDLVNRNKLDEAKKELEQLSEEIHTLSAQIEKQNSSMESMLDTQLMQQLDDSIKTLTRLEKEQQEILGETTRINQGMKESQAKKFERDLKQFFEGLRKDVREAKSLLDNAGQFVETHPAFKQMEELARREAEMERKVQGMNQKAIEATDGDERDRRFKELNEARKALRETVREKDSMRMGAMMRFKAESGKIVEQYDGLEKLAQAEDLSEFNALFKNTYPEVLRQQNNLRMSPNTREDLADRIGADLRELSEINRRISQKLGTLGHELRNDFKNHLTEDMRQNMGRLAERQKQLGGDTRNLSSQLSQMNQKNPLLGREPGEKMSEADRHMRRAEEHLRKSDSQPSIEAENAALQNLSETLESLRQMKEANARPSEKKGEQTRMKLGEGQSLDPRRGSAMQMQKEQVELPSQDQFRVPGEFREDIIEAMKNSFPKKYERMVTEYYKELVK